MKTAKRAIAAILAMILTLGVAPFPAFATTDMPSSMKISADELYAIAGETIEIGVSVSEAHTDLGAISFLLEYDENTLTLIEASNGNALSGFTFNPADNLTSGSEFSWLDMALTNDAKDGTLIKLKFKISESAAVGNYPIKISHSGNVFKDKEERNLTGVVVNDGAIIVYPYKPGDATGNGTCDIGDALRICRYLASGKTLSINEEGADANGDGKVDIADALRLCRYVAGHNVKLLPAPIVCEHSLTATITKEATCVVEGNIAYWYCSKCEAYFADEAASKEITLADTVLSATGHTVVIDEAVAPDYDNTGLTEGSHCSVCDEVIVAQETVPVLEPTYHSITYKDLKTATVPKEYRQYAEHEGFDLPENITVDGYKFEGWYTEPEGGGTKIKYISAGSTTEYVLYAHWSIVSYTITYYDAPVNNNTTEYNIETATFKLKDPAWSGLSFAYWTDAEGNVITQINQGTTGNITLTAHWKYYENLSIPSTNDSVVSSIYDETIGMYHFVFKVGIIDNVILKEYESFDKKVGESLSWSSTEEFSVEDSIAENVADTVKQNISTSNEWSQTSEWAKTHSESENWSLSAGVNFDFKTIKGSIEGSEGGSITNEDSWKESKAEATSNSIGSELENYFESTVSWLTNSSVSMTRMLNLSENMAAGTYTLACVGKVAVYVIVSYNPEGQSYHLETYSVLENNYRTATLYTLPSDSKVSIVENEPLSYSISTDELQSYINSSWYEIQYDANGGDGEMPITVFYSGIDQPLHPNCFTKEGYTFSGWQYQSNTSAIVYQDEQSVCDLANKGETIVLYAIWTANQYAVTLDVAGGNTLSLSTHLVTFNEKYGKNSPLPTPTKIGYEFAGWYNGNNTVDDNSIVKTALDHTLTAKWIPQTYSITFNGNGGTANQLTKDVSYASTYGELPSATREGYTFDGWFTEAAGGTQITSDTATTIDGAPLVETLYAQWSPLTYRFYIVAYDMSYTGSIRYGESYTFSLSDFGSFGLDFHGWYYATSSEIGTGVNGNSLVSQITTSSTFTITVNNSTPIYDGCIYVAAHMTYQDNSCFTGDTLVTLADGSSITLDSLEVGDIIMSWNAITGEFEAMPIALFWNHGENTYNIISLTFSNGKTLKVVTEHGFFDATLNKYVYIDAFNYNDYIGHNFACLDENDMFENVTLITADCKTETSSCYSLRTACNDNAIVDGFLTLTHEDIPGFLTYFEFGNGYMYDEVKMQEDIEEYGLYTYNDWKEYVSYEEFVALNGQYLTIAIGKGYLTYEDVLTLIEGMRQP